MPGKTDDGKPATRADLGVVRADLSADLGALRADLRAVEKRLDQKIDSSVHSLAVELVKTQADVREIKQTMATKDDIGRVLGAIDAFARKGERYDRAAVLHGHALTEHGVQLKDHEKRIASLESSRP